MITIWRGTDGDLEPVRMECEEHSECTTSGERMWINTHFRTEAEAWSSILKSVVAVIKLASDQVLVSRTGLAEAERCSADACTAFVAAHDNYEKWSKERKA